MLSTSLFFFPLPRSYWMRHAVLGWIEVPARAAYYRRWGILVACLVTEAAYLGVVAVLWRMNQVATTWTLVVPFAVSSFALMFGNW